LPVITHDGENFLPSVPTWMGRTKVAGIAVVTVVRWRWRCLQEKKLEGVEAELAQSQSDLQLAFKRIADLQATIEDEILRDSDDEELSDEDRL